MRYTSTERASASTTQYSDTAVHACGRRGSDLHHQVRRTLDSALRDDLEPLAPDEDQVGLQEVSLGEQDVHRAGEDPAEAVLPGEALQEEAESRYGTLVQGARRGSHVKLSGDDLVAVPVVGEPGELGIGPPLRKGSGRFHRGLRFVASGRPSRATAPAAR
jgi:hypothetical protein